VRDFWLVYTGAAFFSKDMWKAVKNLRIHIQKGCIGDAPGIVLYTAVKRDSNGLLRWRCCRGTNRTECYHLQLRKDLANFNSSPRLAHAILLKFNYRRNMRMAVKHGLLSDAYGGWYSQYNIEALQELTSDWPIKPLFPEWRSSRGIADTGERSGLVSSVEVVIGDASVKEGVLQVDTVGMIAAVSDGDDTANITAAGDSDSDSDTERTNRVVRRLPVTASIAYYARMQGLSAGAVAPYTRVSTQQERDKFNREWMRHVNQVSADTDQQFRQCTHKLLLYYGCS
jgi:hypothetical protein